MFRKITSMVCGAVTVFAACACTSAGTNDENGVRQRSNTEINDK